MNWNQLATLPAPSVMRNCKLLSLLTPFYLLLLDSKLTS